MILRDMKKKLLQLATKFPVVSVTGPRQSGKSTLIKNAFPTYAYLSFEDPSTRELFQADPTSFLKRYSHNVIFDEAQRAPELFSYLQGMVDGRDEPGSFIISGSQNFLLSKSVSQSLAGALESCACCRFLMVKSFAAHSARRALGVGRIVGAIRASSHRISIRSISTPRMSRRIWNVMSARSSAWRRSRNSRASYSFVR